MRKRHRSSHRLKHRLQLETERAVRALCAGYHRRKYRRESFPHPTRGSLSEADINALIDDALAEACEQGLRDTIRSDIADRRGAKYTQAVYICESGYKERKRAAKCAIAKRFGLPLE
jgi:hypothetical protein